MPYPLRNGVSHNDVLCCTINDQSEKNRGKSSNTSQDTVALYFRSLQLVNLWRLSTAPVATLHVSAEGETLARHFVPLPFAL